MIDKEIFTKFDKGLDKSMLPFSPSKIKTWKNNPAQFVLRYIYGYPTTSNHKMERGNAVEFGLHQMFTKSANSNECFDTAINYFKSATSFLEEDSDDKQYNMIAPMVEQCFDMLSPYKDNFLSFQGRIDTSIMGVPFYGFTDFVFEKEDEILIVDLKTKAKFEATHDDMLQMAVYKKAFDENFEKPVNVKLLICTPKKCDFFDYVPDEKYIKQIEMNLFQCANVFNACNIADDLKSFCPPKLDDWTWNSAELLEQRNEIWGV